MYYQSFNLLVTAALAAAAPTQDTPPLISGDDIVHVAQSAIDRHGQLQWSEVEGGRIAHMPPLKGKRVVDHHDNEPPKISGDDIIRIAQSAIDYGGQLDWADVEGGRMAHLPSPKGKRDDDPNRFADNSWASGEINTIDGRAVWNMCFSTGSMLQSSNLGAYADTVCPKLVDAVVDHVPGGTFAVDGWQIYQMITDVKSATEGSLVTGALNWALGNADPERGEQMSDAVCRELFKAMENTNCFDDGWTKGIATWARGWVLLGDPEMQGGDP